MASSARFFNQTFRFARNLKRGSTKVQKLASSLHVTNSTSKQFSQLSRPASVFGLINGPAKFNLKSKMQVGAQPENCSLLTRSAAFYSLATEGSEDSSASCMEGSDSSCEAMEGPYGDEDGLVIHWNCPSEDL